MTTTSPGDSIFQSWYFAHHLGGDRTGRDAFAGHRWSDLCAEFCARWDQVSFDHDYRTDGLESFAEAVREVFTRPPHDARFTDDGPARLAS